MTAELNALKSFFASLGAPVLDIWLESCISWCKSEALPPSYTPQELQSEVYAQWLMLDLRQLELPSLPPDLSSKQHFTLTGNFCLQMMKIMDISKPKLWQLQKIRNSSALTRGTVQDAEVAGTGKRMLQLTLTDGVQEAEAMEYKHVPCLSLNLPPGTKMKILGPVVVRRGRLMLEPRNVSLLNGEVQELLVTNAAENVLAKHLKLPENPNPAPIPEKLLVVEKEDKSEGYVSGLPPKAKIIPKRQAELTEDELMSREIDMLLVAEAECKGLQAEENIIPDSFAEADFDYINMSSTSTQVPKRPTAAEEPQDLSALLDEDDDVFNDIDIDAHLDSVEKLNDVPKAKVDTDAQLDNLYAPKPKIITIGKLLELRSNISKGVFKIRARFKGVEEKLTVADGEYKLVIRVEDSTGELTVKVHSDVIAEFAECSAHDVISLKSDVLANDGAATDRMLRTLVRVKDRLLVLEGVMSVQIERDKLPLLTKIS